MPIVLLRVKFHLLNVFYYFIVVLASMTFSPCTLLYMGLNRVDFLMIWMIEPTQKGHFGLDTACIVFWLND